MYNEKQSSFKALLEKDVCFFHEENIKIRATETFKNNNNLAPLQMHKISNWKSCLTPRCNSLFSSHLLSQSIKTLKVYCFSD